MHSQGTALMQLVILFPIKISLTIAINNACGYTHTPPPYTQLLQSTDKPVLKPRNSHSAKQTLSVDPRAWNWIEHFVVICLRNINKPRMLWLCDNSRDNRKESVKKTSDNYRWVIQFTPPRNCDRVTVISSAYFGIETPQRRFPSLSGSVIRIPGLRLFRGQCGVIVGGEKFDALGVWSSPPRED